MLSVLAVVEGAGGKPVTICSVLVKVNYFRQKKVIFLLCASVDFLCLWTDYDQLTSAAAGCKVYCSLSYYIELDVV